MVNWIVVIILLTFFTFGNYSFTDIKEAIVYYGNSISSTYPSIGSCLFLFAILFIIFSEEIISYFQVVKRKVNIKANF